MPIKIKLLLQLLLIVLMQQLVAQPLNLATENEKAHRRYWYYRTRFINDFTNIGGNQGDCICFPERNQGALDNTAKVGPDQIDIMNQYLAALALEYKMLSRNNQSTAETIKEIFYILDTYNRLDSEADLFWTNSSFSGTSLPSDQLPVLNNTNLNGYMLREDMPHDYFDSTVNNQNYKHFNYANTEYNYTGGLANSSYTGLNEITTLSNDNKFSNCQIFGSGTNYSQPKSELPLVQEKFHSMFIAFMMLIKYIPNNTTYTENGNTHQFKDGQTDIKTEVRNITNRIHPYIRGNTFGATASDWTLEYPDGTNLSVGASAFPFSFGLAKMICYINGGYPFSCGSGYQDATSLVAGYIFYNSLTYLTGITNDVSVMEGYMHAGSNALVVAPTWPPLPIIPAWIAMDFNASLHSIEWMELLRKTLHQSGDIMKQLTVFANPISQAPCNGPFNFGGGVNSGGSFWLTQDRNEHPVGNPPPGNYPGADYMLLHNLFYEHLYQLKDAGSLPNNYTLAGSIPTYNLMDNYDELFYPYQHTSGSAFNTHTYLYGVNATISGPNPYWFGTLNAMPGYNKVFQNLESRAQIYATASPFAPTNTIPSKVEYRAGKEITLLPEGNGKPGFEVKLGSDFYAVVKRYVCSSGDYGNGLKQNPNQNDNVASNDYETDEMNTEVPLHYVYYPKSDSDLNPQNTEEHPSEGFAAMEEQQAVLQQLLLEKQQSEQGIYNANATLNQRFLIMPNPNNGVFMLYVNKIANDEVFTYTIMDSKGQNIKTEQNISTNIEQQIDISNYAKGIYLIQLQSNKGFNATKKINVY